MKYEECPNCGGPATRTAQTGDLSCMKQCQETAKAKAERLELEQLTVRMAELLERHAPRTGRFGFSLIMFEFGMKGGNIAYASTAQRDTMKTTLRALLDKWEAEKPS